MVCVHVSVFTGCVHAFPYLWHSWQRRPSLAWLNPGPRSSLSPWAPWWRCCHISGPCEWWAGLWCAGSEGLWGSACTTNAGPWFSWPWNASGSCRTKRPHIRVIHKSKVGCTKIQSVGSTAQLLSTSLNRQKESCPLCISHLIHSTVVEGFECIP